ncbi:MULTISPECIES: hypothetical protein [Paenibacillus]|uniref:Uncharacterized protein n=1 Tax=Paenibacillus pabuli TaxID=1472 RepID=A0A855Y905_9BACL|nr:MULTISPECIES: hypothetical protein [Paenibacillus]PWW37375.1 hypothetical protein DET56_109261 [Paenibacillus pabuli]PXW05517.1 hypothetical protein DEU73_108260 [Paenibacillus taichungensis]
MSEEKVTAKTYWVWTDQAAAKNPSRSVPGVPIWPHYLTDAPKTWLDEGLIIDAEDFVEEGQMSIFDY